LFPWLSRYDALIQLHSGARGSLVGTMLGFLVPSTAPLWLDLVGLFGSLVVLAISGDQFVIALARISASLRVRPTVAAALLGGLGTSIAELIVAGVAVSKSPALAMGSLVGSIVANVCLALAVAALIIPLKVDSATVRREAPVSVASVVLFAILAVGGLTMVKGLIMLVALGAAIAALLLGQRHGREDPIGSEMAEFASTKTGRSSVESVRAVGMLVFMLGGAELMVTSSLGVAKHLGFSDGLAGLTLVGIGTSAPLIAASIQAARKGEHDLVIGNVLGGNLFIALAGGAVVGLLATAKSEDVGDVALVLMTVVVAASWLAMARGAKLRRPEAIILILAYAVCLPFVNR
jgi:cation:H+ antiporter